MKLTRTVARCSLSALFAVVSVACGGGDDGSSDSRMSGGAGSGGTRMAGGGVSAAGAQPSSGAGMVALGGGGAADGAGDAESAGGGGRADGAMPLIPAAPASCPTIADGIISVLGQDVRVWTGPAGKAGPMVFYWHGTGSDADEAELGLGAALDEIRKSGGVVASFSTTTKKGATTGNLVWYTGDFEMADVILACSLEQGLVDARQVFTAGCSAGGLQAGAMVYGRSSYLAAAMPNSGGVLGQPTLEDPTHVPAVITTHGGAKDFVIISFAASSARLDSDVREKGGFVVNCNHGLGHCESPPEVIAAQWQFLKDHPFGVTPEPYSGGLPTSFPETCEIVE